MCLNNNGCAQACLLLGNVSQLSNVAHGPLILNKELNKEVKARMLIGRLNTFFPSVDETDTGQKRPLRNGSAGKVNIPNYYTKHTPDFNKMQLPLDEDDYLQPKSSKPRAYADLIDGQGNSDNE